MKTQAEFMAELFGGAKTHYGVVQSFLPLQPGKLKVEMKGANWGKGLSADQWEDHLAGRKPFGIILLREDNLVSAMCCDIDLKEGREEVNHALLVQRLEAQGYPACVFRSKSGGAHCYLFFRKPIPAKRARELVSAMAVAIGHAGCEIYPKPNEWPVKGLVNWINAPYFGTDRCCVDADARMLALTEFIEYVKPRIIDDLSTVGKPPAPHYVEDLDGAPPCLSAILPRGVGEGMRQNTMKAVAVFAKRKWPDNWQVKLDDLNARFFEPPLEYGALAGLKKRYEEKEYFYPCKETPLVDHCDSRKCRNCTFGVAGGAPHIFVDVINCTNGSPRWNYAILNTGDTVECDSITLLDANRFRVRTYETTGKMLPVMKAVDFTSMMDAAKAKGVEFEQDFEDTYEGQMFLTLQKFLTDNAKGQSMEDLLRDLPYHDEDRDLYHFRSESLKAFFELEKIPFPANITFSVLLSKWGATKSAPRIKNRQLRVWTMPGKLFSKQTESFDIDGVIPEVPI